MKKVLVTGGSGFIGAHLANELARRKYQVTVMDLNYFPGRLDAKINFIKVSLLLRELAKHFKGIESIFHCAALISLEDSLNNPEKYHRVNVDGTLNLLQAALKAGVKRVVYSSSSSVYGLVRKFPQKEDHLPQPLNPYALTKLIGEFYMQVWARCYKLETVSLRYFNVYGPPQEGQNFQTVINIFLKEYFQGKALTVFNQGKMERSFLYIDDLVLANIRAMNSKKVGGGEIINIGQDESYSVLKIAKLISPKIRFVNRRNQTALLKKTFPDIKKAQKLLGWRPQISLQKGLAEMKKAYSKIYEKKI